MGGGHPGASGGFNTGSVILPGSFLVPSARHPEEGGRKEEKEIGKRDKGYSEGSFLPKCLHKQFSTAFLQSKGSSRSWEAGWGGVGESIAFVCGSLVSWYSWKKRHP